MDPVIEVNICSGPSEDIKPWSLIGRSRRQPGEVFGLLGPNGAGKTTTVRLLNGLLPPSAGSARVFGFDPVLDGPSIRQRTGVPTRRPPSTNGCRHARTWNFLPRFKTFPSRTWIAVWMICCLSSSWPRASDKVETYSKGMKQRLALARALVHQPPLLFLDEPTSGLDPRPRNRSMT